MHMIKVEILYNTLLKLEDKEHGRIDKCGTWLL